MQWVDQTYYHKHQGESPQDLRATYYEQLAKYPTSGPTSRQRTPRDAVIAFLLRYGRRAGLSLVIYMLSYLPLVGRLVLPAVSFYTFNRAVGPVPAAVVFGSGLFLPKRYLVSFLTSYFSSRSLMRELVSRKSHPYTSLIASWSRTFPASIFLLNKSENGFVIVKASALGSASASISFCGSRFLVS